MSFETLIEDAEYFHSQAQVANFEPTKRRYYVAAILHAWMAIESFVNDMLEDFTNLPEGVFTVHERAFLSENSVEFSRSGPTAGEFIISVRDEYKRLDDKILFLVAKFGGGSKFDRSTALWSKFQNIREKRNELVHPRKNHEVSVTGSDAEESISMAKDIISLLGKSIWDIVIQF